MQTRKLKDMMMPKYSTLDANVDTQRSVARTYAKVYRAEGGTIDQARKELRDGLPKRSNGQGYTAGKNLKGQDSFVNQNTGKTDPSNKFKTLVSKLKGENPGWSNADVTQYLVDEQMKKGWIKGGKKPNEAAQTPRKEDKKKKEKKEKKDGISKVASLYKSIPDGSKVGDKFEAYNRMLDVILFSPYGSGKSMSWFKEEHFDPSKLGSTLSRSTALNAGEADTNSRLTLLKQGCMGIELACVSILEQHQNGMYRAALVTAMSSLHKRHVQSDMSSRVVNGYIKERAHQINLDEYGDIVRANPIKDPTGSIVKPDRDNAHAVDIAEFYAFVLKAVLKRRICQTKVKGIMEHVTSQALNFLAEHHDALLHSVDEKKKFSDDTLRNIVGSAGVGIVRQVIAEMCNNMLGMLTTTLSVIRYPRFGALVSGIQQGLLRLMNDEKEDTCMETLEPAMKELQGILKAITDTRDTPDTIVARLTTMMDSNAGTNLAAKTLIEFDGLKNATIQIKLWNMVHHALVHPSIAAREFTNEKKFNPKTYSTPGEKAMIDKATALLRAHVLRLVFDEPAHAPEGKSMSKLQKLRAALDLAGRVRTFDFYLHMVKDRKLTTFDPVASGNVNAFFSYPVATAGEVAGTYGSEMVGHIARVLGFSNVDMSKYDIAGNKTTYTKVIANNADHFGMLLSRPDKTDEESKALLEQIRSDPALHQTKPNGKDSSKVWVFPVNVPPSNARQGVIEARDALRADGPAQPQAAGRPARQGLEMMDEGEEPNGGG